MAKDTHSPAIPHPLQPLLQHLRTGSALRAFGTASSAQAADRAGFARAGERAVRLTTRDPFTEVLLPDGRRGWAPTPKVGSVWGR